ncbi:MAG: PUA domain-containing protein, partial [Candidatus Bathyarchaeia archaeon]
MSTLRDSVEKLRSIADYQFGSGAGKALFSDDVRITYSRKTGKIRCIYEGDSLIATLRPLDGYLSLTVAGAEKLIRGFSTPRYFIMVTEEAVPFVSRGGSVFAKYVKDADEEIRPKDEVVVIDSEGRVVAVGRSILSGVEMKKFRSGIAVKTRRGLEEKVK